MCKSPRALKNPLLICVLAGSLAGCASAPDSSSPVGKPIALPAPPEMGPPPDRPGPTRLPLGIDPVAYELELWIDPRKDSFVGTGRIEVDLKQATTRIWMHKGLETKINAVQCRAGGRTLGANVDPAKAEEGGEPAAGEVVVTCADRLQPGRVWLDFAWEAPFDTRLAGLYRAKVAGTAANGEPDRWYAYTQFEAMDARKAFPSFDEPRWKVPFRTTLYVPTGMEGFSNTPVKDKVVEGEWTKLVFQETKPLPTYLVAFVVGDVDVVGIDAAGLPPGSPPIRGITTKGRGEQVRPALEMAAQILPLLADYFGRPYPYDKLDLAALAEFGSGAMENAGLVTFREEALLVDPATTATSHMRGIASIIAHELAHQWFGNLVTMPWWDDLWLNEAFATWMAAKVVDQWKPEYDERTDLLGGKLWVFGEDVLAAARAVRNPVRGMAEAEASFDGLTYVKGASVLTMIEQWIGEEAFRQGLRAYMNRHAWGSATAEDLFRALGEASGKDVAGVARTFIERPGVPLVSAHLVCAGDIPTVTVSQSRYRPVGSVAPELLPEGGPWKIPVCVQWPEGGAVKNACTLLQGVSGTIRLEGAFSCPAWLHPNADEAGYYRWSIAEEGLQALVKARQALPRRSRVGLLDQAWAMVAAGRLKPAAYLRAAETMADTTDRHVAEQLAWAVERVRHTWEDMAATPAFQGWVGRVMGPLGQRLGWDSKEGESEDDALLRPRVMATLASGAKDAKVLDRLRGAAADYLKDPRSLSPDLATMVMAEAARAGLVTFDQLSGLLERAVQPAVRVNCLRGLGTLPAGRGLEEALALSMTEAVRAQDLRRVFGPAWSGGSAERRVTLQFTETRWADLTARLPSFGWGSAARMPERVGDFCDTAGRDSARKLFEAKLPNQGVRHLKLGLEKADQCIALRTSQSLAMSPAPEAASDAVKETH